MKGLKLLVIEDDKEFLDLIKLLLKKNGISNIESASNPLEGLIDFQRFQPDVCLVDIVLGQEPKGGIKFAKLIRDQGSNVKIIFMTSHFTEEVYEEVKHLNPNSFMNKELSSLKLKQAIELAWGGVKPSESNQFDTTEANLVSAPKMTDGNFFFKVGDSFKAIDLTEVSFFHADGKMTFARIGSRNYATNVQLKVLEIGLSRTFLRCHRKYLINVKKITSIKTKDNIIYMDKESLPIGYAYRKSFLDGLNLLK